jgi:hypothetical protein
MAKITRFNGNLKAPAADALGTERTIFGSVSQANDLTSQFSADLLRGWGIVGPSDQPTLQDFNAMGYTLGQLHAYLHQVGVPEWNSLQEYHIGSFTNHNSRLYFSLSNTNVGNTPGSSPTQWAVANLLDSTRVDVASSATVTLTTSAPNTRNINITGTTAITAFTIAAGQTYFVRFAAALTLTNNASIVTQSGGSITTAGGDTCIIRATSANVVEVLSYVSASMSGRKAQASALDGTAGSVLLTGAGGLLTLGDIPNIGNMDSMKATGWYKFANGVDTGTLPVGVSNGVVESITFSSSISRQTLYAVTGGADVVTVYTRQIRGTTIVGPWVPIYDDSSDQTPTLVNSFTQDGTAPLRYRRVGKQVIIVGRVRRTTVSAILTTITTIPAGFTPPGVLVSTVCLMGLDSGLSQQPVSLNIGSGGTLQYAFPTGAPTGAALAGANFIDINITYFIP